MMARRKSAEWEVDGNVHLGVTDSRLRPYHEVVAGAVVRHVGEQARVLDLGCGAGFVSALLAARLPDVDLWAADAYDECLAATSRRVPRATTVRIPENDLDIDGIEGQFDAIVMSHVLEHTPRPVDALRHVLERLKPGGVCVLAVPNPATPLGLWRGLRRIHYVNRGHVVAWDPSHWRNFLQRVVGADVVEYLADEVRVFPQWAVKRLPALARLQRSLARWVPWWSFSNIAVVRAPTGAAAAGDR